MKALHIKDIPILENKHGIDARKIYDKPEAEIIHITLKPGENLLKHITHSNVVFYVLEGKGIVEIGDENKEVEANTAIESPKGIPHSWKNTGNSILRILVIKVPKPEKPATII